LKEVKQILSAADQTIELDSKSLDSKHFREQASLIDFLNVSAVPEIQGTTQEVAIAKCRRAAELVSVFPSKL